MPLHPSIRQLARHPIRRVRPFASASRPSYWAIALVLSFAACGSSAAASTVPYQVVAQGAVGASGDDPQTAAKLVSSRAAAEKLLRDWDLERAKAKLAGVDFGKHRLLILVARGSSTAARLDLRKLTTIGRRLSATGEVTTRKGVIGGQAQSRPYALVTVPRSVDATSARLTLTR